MSRGQRQEPIYDDDTDRKTFRDILGETVERYHWRCYAYCQMSNHYHLLIETAHANLSAGMRYLNGVYTQASNRRHGRVGHVFQGRYKAILVDAETYLLELSRYIVLNPVRAKITKTPGDWPWSSYRATAGEAPAPKWLDIRSILSHFAEDPSRAHMRYKEFVMNGADKKDIWNDVRQQVYLGDEQFVERMRAATEIPDDPGIPRIYKQTPAPPLEEIAEAASTRNDAIVTSYKTGAYSYADIGKYFGMHPGSVGRIVRQKLTHTS